MKRALLTASVFALSITPALAGGGGSDSGIAAMVIQQVTRLAEKLIDLFN